MCECVCQETERERLCVCVSVCQETEREWGGGDVAVLFIVCFCFLFFVLWTALRIPETSPHLYQAAQTTKVHVPSCHRRVSRTE